MMVSPSTAPEPAPLISVATDTIARVLSPYKKEAAYLLRATVDPNPREDAVVAAHGEFAIPFSCYIADTGHFNAVEFNICYNQLAYVLLGQCVISGLLPPLEIDSFDEYRRRQLPDFLILRLKSSFRAAIDPRAFSGTVAVRSAKRKMSMLMIDTAVSFTDPTGARSEGEVLLGVIDSAKRQSSG